MKKRKIVFILVSWFFLFILSGCATNEAQRVVISGTNKYISSYSPNDSDYQSVIRVDEIGGISLFSVLQIAAAGYAGSVDGLSGAARSLAIDESVANRRVKVGEANLLFAWLPQSYGQSASEVEERYAAEVVEAVSATLSGRGMSIHTESPIARKPDYGRRFYRVSGQACGDRAAAKCLVELTFAGELIPKPTLKNGPSSVSQLSEKKVWSLTTRGGAQAGHRAVAFMAPNDSDIDVEQIYVDISRNLPEDSYMYIARSPTYHVPVGTPGKIKGYYYALHEGEELSFARQ